MERVPRVEQPVIPEKSRDLLFFDTLKAKRDVLSSHYTLNQLRRGRKVEEMSEAEVEDYKSVKNEYDKRKELFLASFDNLSEDDGQKIAELTSLTRVEVALSTLDHSREAGTETATEKKVDQPAIETPIRQTPEEIVGETRIHPEQQGVVGEVVSPADAESPERGITMAEIDRMLKYSKDTARPLETAYWEAKKAELLERQEAEANPDRTAPKGFGQKVKAAFDDAMNTWVEVDPKMWPLFGWPDWTKEKPTGPETKSKTTEAAPKKETKIKKPSLWGWLKERGKGIITFGLWEFHQAERLRKKTKEVENDIRALAKNIQHEINLEPEEAETTAWEIVNELKKKNLDISAPEFFEASRDIFEKKAAENAEEENYIIKSAWEDLQTKAKKYRGEAGQDVFIEEIRIKFESDLKKELNKVRNGAIKEDVVKFAGVMRNALDENWQWRYVWGGLESLADVWMLKYFAGNSLVNKGTALLGKAGAKEASQAGLKDTIWAESKRQLISHGIANPTNMQIQEVATQIAKDSGVKVVSKATGNVIWDQTAGGIFKDIALQKGFMLKLGGGIKKALAIKAGAGL